MDRRHKIFFSLTAVIFLVILLRMIMLASPLGNAYRQESEQISSKTGKLSAIRGRIYKDDDQLLVWSERCYDLLFDNSNTSAKRLKILQKMLAKDFPNVSLPLKRKTDKAVIKYNLTASELAAADDLSIRFPEFSVDLRWERRCADPAFYTGEVRQIDGMEVGISGLEKQFDSRLRGTPGTFSVMLDRHGHWINQTFKIIEPSRAGEDIFLDEATGETAP